jgi:hypothetical protein
MASLVASYMGPTHQHMHDDDRMIGNVVIDVKTEKKIKKKRSTFAPGQGAKRCKVCRPHSK